MQISDLRRDRILNLLKRARESGATFTPISGIDGYVQAKEPAVFLKHDIHNVVPGKLIDFARCEAELDVLGTYFFMSYGHPRGAKFFTLEDQKTMMREVADLGHEIGAHFDVLYDTRHHGKTLSAAVQEQLEDFAEIVGPISIANLHGNSKFKIVDNDGNNLVYDLFDELARQPDFPELSNVAPDIADFIRSNRSSLDSLNLSHWGDSWIWAKTKGLIAAGLVSDNWMEKESVLQVTINAEHPCAYGLDPKQTIGPRDGRAQATWVDVGKSLPSEYRHNQRRFRIEEEATSAFFEEALPKAPFTMLLHPEFYAV